METRQTTTISLPAEMMEFVRDNSENVSKFMQELVSNCMKSYDPFNQQNNYDETARKLANRALVLLDMYIDGERQKGECTEVSTAATCETYALKVIATPDSLGIDPRTEVEITGLAKPPYTLDVEFNIDSRTKVLRIYVIFKNPKVGACAYNIEVAQTDELYSSVSNRIAKYCTLVSSEI